jgi:hypothetical protein
VAPQEKDLVLVVQERGDRDRRLAKEVVIEMTAVRQFHVGEIRLNHWFALTVFSLMVFQRKGRFSSER